jgi:DNA gyrase/topoisomerase IV subunit B
MGRGNEITVEVNDNDIKVTDKGAGVPHGKNKDTEEVLIEIYTSAHSSGKFDSSNYKRVRGMHGIGSSTVCVCSKVFEVWTRRDEESGTWLSMMAFRKQIRRASYELQRKQVQQYILSLIRKFFI